MYLHACNKSNEGHLALRGVASARPSSLDKNLHLYYGGPCRRCADSGSSPRYLFSPSSNIPQPSIHFWRDFDQILLFSFAFWRLLSTSTSHLPAIEAINTLHMLLASDPVCVLLRLGRVLFRRDGTLLSVSPTLARPRECPGSLMVQMRLGGRGGLKLPHYVDVLKPYIAGQTVMRHAYIP
jgi:hypothetical protein